MAKRSKSSKTGKIRYTFHLHEAVVEKARDLVYWLPDETMASLCEAALIEYIDRLETERGKSFPRRRGKIAVGRPKKS